MSIKTFAKLFLLYFALTSCSISTSIDKKSQQHEHKSYFKSKQSDYLWTAAIQCLSFMTFKEIERSNGLISTDWYENSDHPKDRYSINIVILSDKIQISSLSVSLNKQSLVGGRWINVNYDKSLEYEIAASIVYQAKKNKLRI